MQRVYRSVRFPMMMWNTKKVVLVGANGRAQREKDVHGVGKQRIRVGIPGERPAARRLRSPLKIKTSHKQAERARYYLPPTKEM